MFVLALWYARKERWLLIGLVGYIIVAMFSAPRERPFSTLMLMTFFAMAGSRKYIIKQPKFLAIALIAVAVVFSCRLRASCIQRRIYDNPDYESAVRITDKMPPFADLTYEGIPYLWWRGLAHIGLEESELGISEIKQAYTKNPFNIHVINMTGYVYGLEKDYRRARSYFEQALKIAPDYEDAKNNLKKVMKNGY
jgi:tetratricopeptide (TPR) repeat protein